MHHSTRRWLWRGGFVFLILSQLTACNVTVPVKESESVVQEATTPIRKPKPAVVAAPASLSTLASMQRRLDTVSAPLLIENTAFCKQNVRNLLGFNAKNRHSYSSERAEIAAKELGLGERLQITSIMPRSGASRVWLRRGDELLKIAGKPVPQGEGAEYHAPTFLAPHVLGESTLPLIVQRGDKRIKISLPLTQACGYRIELGNADEANLFVDGVRIMVTRGMMKLAGTDNELAYVIAKGMAHNIFRHPHQLKVTKAARALINDLLVSSPEMPYQEASGLTPIPEEMDVLADRMALYLLVRAGYDIDEAPVFWRRLASSSAADSFTSLHPATDARIAAMEKTIRDIKQARLRR